MAKENCPRADFYEKFQVNSIFNVSIVSAYSIHKDLVYCIDSSRIEHLLKIDDYKHYKKLRKEPRCGTYFVYYSSTRCSYFRAYMLGECSGAPGIIKAFFVDTGEVHFLRYERGKFFMLPKCLDFEALALFCKINSFPGQFSSMADFIENSMLEKLTFKVLGTVTAENYLRSEETCLLVDVLEDNDFKNDENLTFPKLTVETLNKFELTFCEKPKYSYTAEPFMAKAIQQQLQNFEPQDKVLVYLGMMIKHDLFFGICKNLDEAGYYIKSLVELMIKLNKLNVLHELLNRTPIVHEMVVVCECIDGNVRYYRGLVLEIIGNISMILYVDYGYTRPYSNEKLYKFPIEFSKFPFHCSRVHISNIETSKDFIENCNNMLFVKKSLEPYGYGLVEAFNGFDITVKLYNNKGLAIQEGVNAKDGQLTCGLA